MGCNCKGVRKIEKLFNNNNNTIVDNRGLKYYLLKTIEIILEIINRIITISLIIVLMPIVLVVLIGGYILNGTLKIKIPFKFKKLITDYYAKKLQNTDGYSEGQTS